MKLRQEEIKLDEVSAIFENFLKEIKQERVRVSIKRVDDLENSSVRVFIPYSAGKINLDFRVTKAMDVCYIYFSFIPRTNGIKYTSSFGMFQDFDDLESALFNKSVNILQELKKPESTVDDYISNKVAKRFLQDNTEITKVEDSTSKLLKIPKWVRTIFSAE
ncbi:hypothetical protein Molly5_27 [Maribacter phage Molly_5]|uniref:Uncharacterized protein n=2 Tax=Mollyvirus TaxID=2948826 RepID=A0A8E4XVA6_9CAUD|nr:hypothetical protein M1M29_gp027 [Maribacter phage Molly_1]YP_010357275.1 hypothetical protein M1M30_gp026 [Maribacter phage Colly_1]QQO97708.1 hypothetical protein Molly2_27 [Maribacter phage Molly_2]QQO97908.1 hypothetical protein Molly3_27 [Maribacter phage Molly_3]QQO98108.1 hypothetical protein Molly4_27 [Maribacter phage Molly_4]QQO98308.1 hypothetical protein Molly5_27 [Maribacter phage Molly_5]QQO97307.1 hypothetical protein Colly1_26 [Maribacter phage Colly_1]